MQVFMFNALKLWYIRYIGLVSDKLLKQVFTAPWCSVLLQIIQISYLILI